MLKVCRVNEFQAKTNLIKYFLIINLPSSLFRHKMFNVIKHLTILILKILIFYIFILPVSFIDVFVGKSYLTGVPRGVCRQMIFHLLPVT